MKYEAIRSMSIGVGLVSMLISTATAVRGAAHCPGDVDAVVLDGRITVDVFDFGVLAASFGSLVPAGTNGDLDGSGGVDVFDFGILAGSFGCIARVDEIGTMHPPEPGFDDGRGYGEVQNNYFAIADDVFGQIFASMAVSGSLKSECDVYLHTGELYHTACDLRVAGREQDFVWTRKYRSGIGPDTGMGNGWDFSYNIRIRPSGSDLLLWDGNTRRDLYLFQPDLTWTDEEFFRTIEQELDLSYTLRFAHGETWSLLPLDGAPAEGRVSEITDRNGNLLSFEYDGLGRLTVIRDTLHHAGNPREITVAYNPDGFIESVTDFTGRQVIYDYYDGIEPGGSFGDLKSVTTPPVSTAHNPFLAGKTTVYTYSTGFANDRLNHNLLTITDPKGQTYLMAEYGATLAPADLEYDRVSRLVVGDPDDNIDCFYTPLTPAAPNNFACIKTTTNDRVGNVDEFFYDDDARLVMVREYTGRGNPGLPTDIDGAINLPVGQLRPTDPALFETRLEWNGDSLCTRIVHPNANETLSVYDELNLDRRSRGNLLSLTRLPGPLGGDQPSIVELFEYDSIINFDSNFVTRHTDERGNDTTFQFDAQGNLTQVTHRILSIVEGFQFNAFGQLTRHILPDNGAAHRREDAYTYYGPADGCMNGYPKDQIVDDTGFALTTTYEYDCLGRRTRSIDPRGNDSLYEFNELDQVVRAQSRQVTTVIPVRYETVRFYDENDNLVRSDISNRDDQGVLQPNTHYSTIYEHDILNNVTRVCDESGADQLDTIDDDCGAVDQNEFVTTEYLYDKNRNLTDVLYGEGTNGNDPNNRVRYRYDERDLVLDETCAPADPERSTTEYDYDGNRNRTEVRQGVEADTTPLYAGDTSRVYVYLYDGYNRTLRLTDPMDNVHICEYDAAGNRVRLRRRGEILDIVGDAGNVRLYEQTCDYDPMDRFTECRTEHFDTATQIAIGDGQSTWSCTYNDCSQYLSCTDDNSNTTTYLYDTALRCSSVTDARGNSAVCVYDANSNVTSTTETEKSDLGNPDEVYTSTCTFDELDRTVQCVDPVGNTTDFRYDSRSNRTGTVDARGNVVRCTFDGLNRLLAVDRDLTDTGDGAGLVIGTATTLYTWDDSHRLSQFQDDNGHITLYAYDSLSRRIVTTRADGTLALTAYDHHHNVFQTMDPNLTIVDNRYDLLDRIAHRDVLVGPSVSNDTTFEDYTFDGLSRLVLAQDDDSTVTGAYDSMSNCTSETLAIGAAPAHTTTCVYDGWGNRTLCVYPSGRQIGRTYDVLNRCVQIQDGGLPHVQVDRVGWNPNEFDPISVAIRQDRWFSESMFGNYDRRSISRVERLTFDNGTQSDFTFDGIANAPGDFGVKKIVGIDHSVTLGGTFDQRSYTWDPAANKSTNDIRVGPPHLETAHGYDSLCRLLETTEVDPATTGIRRLTVRALDDVGNRSSESGSFGSGGYVLDATAPSPADAQVNQYSRGTIMDLTNDDNGNRTGEITLNTTDLDLFMYDYRDQLTSVTLSSGDIVSFTHDPLGRRAEKVFVPTVGPPDTTRFYYCARMDTAPPILIEERDGSDVTTETYVRLQDLGAALIVDRDSDSDRDDLVSLQTAGQDYFYHCDDLGSTVALTDQFGSVVERYSYGDFGRVRIGIDTQEPDEPQGALVSDADPTVFGSTEEVADNFILGPRRVTALRWWGGYSASFDPPDTFFIRIYDDAGGLPGLLLYEELGIAQVGEAKNGLSFGLPEYVYTYELSRPFTPPVPGVQYWISIQNDTTVQPLVAWAWTISSSGDGLLATSSNAAPFVIEPFDVAIELYTDQSIVDNPYLWQGERYDEETRLFFIEDEVGSAPAISIAMEVTRGPCGYYLDPKSGRTLTRQFMDGLGNNYCIAGNNPVSGSISRHSTSGSLGMARFVPEVYVLKKEEGGRHTPFYNKYRPQFYMRTTDVTGRVTLPEGTEMVMPGDNIRLARCDTVLMDPGVVLSNPTRSSVFAIWQTVGYFEVNMSTPMFLFGGPGGGLVPNDSPTQPTPDYGPPKGPSLPTDGPVPLPGSPTPRPPKPPTPTPPKSPTLPSPPRGPSLPPITPPKPPSGPNTLPPWVFPKPHGYFPNR